MKRKALTVGGAFLSLWLLAAPLNASAVTYENDADVNAVEKALDSIDAYTTALGDSSASVDTVVADGVTAQTDLGAIASHGFVTDFGAQYTSAADKLKADATAIATQIGNMDAALQANDNTKIQSYVTPLNNAIDTFNSDESSLNDSVDQHNSVRTKTAKTETAGYLALFIAALLLTIGSFVWARRNSGKDPMLDTARSKVAKASIFPLIGAGITYGTFLFASKTGGTYFIAYGPILIGGVAFARALADYKKHVSTSTGVSPVPLSMQATGGSAFNSPPVMPTQPSPQSVAPTVQPMPTYAPTPPTNFSPVPPQPNQPPIDQQPPYQQPPQQ